jgi:hypothetical protein
VADLNRHGALEYLGDALKANIRLEFAYPHKLIVFKSRPDWTVRNAYESIGRENERI